MGKVAFRGHVVGFELRGFLQLRADRKRWKVVLRAVCIGEVYQGRGDNRRSLRRAIGDEKMLLGSRAEEKHHNCKRDCAHDLDAQEMRFVFVAFVWNEIVNEELLELHAISMP